MTGWDTILFGGGRPGWVLDHINRSKLLIPYRTRYFCRALSVHPPGNGVHSRNASVFFQRFMNQVLADYRNFEAMPYQDDVQICSDDAKIYVESDDKVLTIRTDAGLKLELR